MPRDLFGDVTRPSITLGTRKWYTVPLSLAAHVGVIVPLVLVPLVASDVLPLPHEYNVLFVAAPTPPEPPAAPVQPRETTRPRANPDAAPLEAPSAITPDNHDVFEPPELPNVVVPGALPGLGAVITAPEPPPPAQPAPAQPVRVADLHRPPVKVANVAPVYPTVALVAHAEGIVILEAIIDTDGSVQNLRVLRSHVLFDQAALDAVRQWRYTPSYYNGAPVRVVMTVTVSFTLKR